MVHSDWLHTKVSKARVRVQQIGFEWTLMRIHLNTLFLTQLLLLFIFSFKRSSQTLNLSGVMLFNVLIMNSQLLSWTQQNSRHEVPLAMRQNRSQSTVVVLVKGLLPPSPRFFPPPYNRAHPQSTHPLPALDHQTWEASPPGLEGRMNTMINMFSRPLVFMTLTFNNLLMTSG